MARNTSLPIGMGLDIGTRAVRAIIGISEEDAPNPSIIGFGEAPNRGVRKGVIADIEETVSAISTAVDEAMRIAGVEIKGATVGVNGTHLVSIGSHGVIAVGGTGREISEQDVSRAEEAATVIQLPPNRETIQAFPRNYQIDGQEHIKDPVGMNGVRLEVDTTLITAATPFLKNLSRAVNQAGLEVNGFIAGPLAASTTLLNNQQREPGTVLIDMGATTTGMAIYEEGELLHVAVLPLGSGHITNDLAIGLRTETETAELVKLRHVDAAPAQLKDMRESKVKVKELNGEYLVVSRREINMIAQARLDELFGLIDAELKKVNRQGMLAGGAVLTGGGAKLGHLDDYAKKALRLPARVGRPAGFSGVIDKISDPVYATAIGLMMEDLKTKTTPSGLHGNLALVNDTTQWLKRLLTSWRK